MSTRPLDQLIIRPMTEEDLDQVERLEQTTFPEPWSRVCFRQDLYRPLSLAVVAQLGEQVAGYAVAWIEQELHVANIAVVPEYRRRGIGAKLVQAAEEFGRRLRARSLYLEVRQSNTGAREFYRRLGFIQTYVRTGYYANGEEAIVLERDLGPEAE